MTDSDSEAIRELVRRALYDEGGELVEGGFVDRWESFADQALEELEDLLPPGALSPEIEDSIAEILTEPRAPAPRVARLLVWLKPRTGKLLERLMASESVAARQAAALAIGELGLSDLVERARTDPNPIVRAATLRELTSARHPNLDIQSLMRQAATEDPAYEVRVVAAPAIRFFRDPKGQALLCRLLEEDPHPAVRRAILKGLAEEIRRIGITVSGPSIREGIGPALFETVLKALGHDDPEIRYLMAMAAERICGEDVARAMLERFRVEQDPKVRARLAHFGGFAAIADESFPVLVDLFQNDTNPAVRVWVGFLFESFGARAEPVMLDALADRFEGVHRPAVMSLKRVGTKRSLPALAKLYATATDSWFLREIEIALTDIVINASLQTGEPWPEDAAGRIQRRIDELNPADFGQWPSRVCKEDLRALPIWGRGIDLWALRPTGEILVLDLDSVRHETWSEDDPLNRFAAMIHGAETYPELTDLIPPPPENTRPCTLCRTAGRDEGASSCPSCSGLGWTRRT